MRALNLVGLAALNLGLVTANVMACASNSPQSGAGHSPAHTSCGSRDGHRLGPAWGMMFSTGLPAGGTRAYIPAPPQSQVLTMGGTVYNIDGGGGMVLACGDQPSKQEPAAGSTVGDPGRTPRTSNDGTPDVFTHPLPNGGYSVTTFNTDGTMTTARVGADGTVIDATTTRPVQPGPGEKGAPAAGDQSRGYTYGNTHYGEDGGGYTDILDKDGKVVGAKFFGRSDAASQPGDNNGTERTPVAPPGSCGTSQQDPIVTNTGDGSITSTQNPDGSWTHVFENDMVKFRLSPDDPRYPHDDIRFRYGRNEQADNERPVITEREDGTVTSTRNPDGTWTHVFENDAVKYRLRPDDARYPHDDPRFAPSAGSGGSSPVR